MIRVLINPGHSKNGVPDPGACANGYKEALVAAQISDLVKSYLEAQSKSNGYELEVDVHQQGGADKTANKQLNELIQYANSTEPDLFVSIHLNAATPIARGIETLYHGTSVKGKLIAQAIQNALTTDINGYTFLNRGIKADTRGLAVLKSTNMPSCLVEVGFISNPNDIKAVVSSTATIGVRIGNGILKYLLDQKLIVAGSKPQIQPTTHPEFKLEPVKDVYNLYIDGKPVLKENKLSTCVSYLYNKYCN